MEGGPPKRVGIALRHAKAKKHLKTKLMEMAAAVGIEIKYIDPGVTLREQEPFDVLIHKIRDAEWHKRVKEYKQNERPDLRVVDSYDSVMQLANRISMLDPMRQGLVLRAPSKGNEVRSREECDQRIWQRANTLDERRQQLVYIAVPDQLVLEEETLNRGLIVKQSYLKPDASSSCQLSKPKARYVANHTSNVGMNAEGKRESNAGASPEDAREAAGNAGFSPPYLGKPLWADGREGSHGLLVIKDEQGLAQLAKGPRPSTPGLPVVLQEFVPHGACLFKVYVMGPITILVRRPSLRLPIAEGDLLEEVGQVQSVGRVSAYHSESEFGSAPKWDPPHWAVQALALELRKRYNLTLFNFDLIQPDRSQPGGTSQHPEPDFLLLDINAFPGFEKLPDYEELFVLYLQSLFASSEVPEQRLTRFVAHSHVHSPRDLSVPE